MANLSNPPAIVLGSGVTALGTLRCLSAAGIPAYSYSRDCGLERHSRHCSRIKSDKSASVFDVLEASGISEAVLFPTSDHWLDELASSSDKLGTNYRVSIPTSEVLNALVEKDALRNTLDTYDVACPETLSITSIEELEAVAEDKFRSYFLKPCDSQAFFCTYGFKAFPVCEKQQALNHFREAEAKELRLVLQEYVAGPATNYFYIEGFFDSEGNECTRFLRRRDRMYPKDYGNSTMMTSIAPDAYPNAASSLVAMLKALGYRGVYSAEFKYDDELRVAKLLEINCRPWWYIEFAKNCGINFPKLAYQDALGRKVDAWWDYQVGRSLIYPYYDAHVISAYWERGQRQPFSWAWSWIKSDYAVWQFGDPLPALFWFWGRIKARLRRGFGKGEVDGR